MSTRRRAARRARDRDGERRRVAGGDRHLSKGHSGHRSLTADTCQRAGESAAVVALARIDERSHPGNSACACADAPPMQVGQQLAPEQPPRPSRSAWRSRAVARGAVAVVLSRRGADVELISHYVRIELSLFTPAPTSASALAIRRRLWIPVHGELGFAVPVLRERVQLTSRPISRGLHRWQRRRGDQSETQREHLVRGGRRRSAAPWLVAKLAAQVDGRVGYAFDAPKFVIQSTEVCGPDAHGRVGIGLEWLF